MANTKRKTTNYSIIVILVFVLFSCTKQRYLPTWMIGEWQTELNGIRVIETWKDNSESFAGTTIWDDHGLKSKEDLRLYFDENDLVYEVTIEKVKRKFICHDVDNDTLIFVNNQNDFPRRIIYTKPVEGQMKVWIDNFQNDIQTMTFYFEKK